MQKKILHPYLFSLYFILLLFSDNIALVTFSDSVRILLFQLICVTILLVFIRLITRGWRRAALFTTLTILLFNSYGLLYFAINRNFSANTPLARADILAAIYAASFIILGWYLLRKLPEPQPLNYLFNIIALTLLVFPLIRIGYFYLAAFPTTSQAAENPTSEPLQLHASSPRPPDIYYIILDEYVREDVLAEIMQFDNTALIEYLRETGFYVADKSHSNYSVTQYSLISSLDMDFLPQVSDAELASQERMQQNRVRRSLEAAGYKFITFASGYALTEITDSDYYLKPRGYLNTFEFTYISSTALAVAAESLYGIQYRNLITYSFEELKEIHNIEPDKPKFIFAHIQAAHAPFVFGPNGETDQVWIYPLTPAAMEAAKSSYVQAYDDQLFYINRLLVDTLAAILAGSDPQPVIIIQSDHGPQSLFNWNSLENVCLKERMAILNAYYLPDFDYQNLYPTISPVNSFRMIFDSYFETELGLLPDRSYLTYLAGLSHIKEVTNDVERCEQSPGK